MTPPPDTDITAAGCALLPYEKVFDTGTPPPADSTNEVICPPDEYDHDPAYAVVDASHPATAALAGAPEPHPGTLDPATVHAAAKRLNPSYAKSQAYRMTVEYLQTGGYALFAVPPGVAQGAALGERGTFVGKGLFA